jgi:hypothetical protein
MYSTCDLAASVVAARRASTVLTCSHAVPPTSAIAATTWMNSTNE